MSKRNSKLKIHSREFKMPKLDVSVEKPHTSKKFNNTNNSVEKFKNAFVKPVPVVDLWDDDDDEDLLFASQMVENNNKNMSTAIATESFSTFGRNVTSSTQVEFVPIPAPNLFEEDSFDFTIDQNLFNDNDFNKQNINLKKTSTISKPPVQKIHDSLMNDLVYPNTATSLKRCISRSNSKGYDNSNEAIEVNKLVQRLDILNEESKKQNQQINELNEKLLTKEGEVSVLRFEQRQLKQQIDTLRIQKITEADVIKKDWQDRIQELEKNLNKKTFDLNLKTNEIIKLKQSLFSDNRTVEVKKNYKSIGIFYRLNCRNSLKIVSKKRENDELSVDIFKKPDQNYTYIDNYYQQELGEICNVLAEIQFNPTKLRNSNTKQLLLNTILESTTRALTALPKYYVSLNLKIFQNESTKSKFNILENSQICYLHKNNSTTINICQPNELFLNEKMIPLRRYISALGIICQKLTNIKLETTENNNSNNYSKIPLEKLMELIKDSPNHFGVLESIAFLLSALANINRIKPYINLLKNLIFYKSNIRTLTEISKCLLMISTNKDIEVLNLLCQKSEGYLCLLNDTKKKIRIHRNTSCILQIYGLILESAYKQYKTLNTNQWELLTQTCSNHMEFLRNCFDKYPHFLTTNSETKCLCYVQICTSFVILFHLFLRHCIEHPINKNRHNVRQICKLGSLLIFDIFYTNYRKCILQKGGTAIKQRLYVTCEWLNENFDSLGLSREYQIAIERLRTSSIFVDLNFNNEENQPICRERGNKILRKTFHNSFF